MREKSDRGNAKITTILLILMLSFGLFIPNFSLAQDTQETITPENLEEAEVKEPGLIADNGEGLMPEDDLEATSDLTDEVEGSATEQLTEYVRERTYPEYLALYEEHNRPKKEIIIAADSFSRASSNTEVVSNVDGIAVGSVLTGETGFVEWDVYVEEAGLYNLELTFRQVEGRSSAIQRSIEINGEKPFSEAGFLTLARVWGDEGPVKIDVNGNHLRPKQIEKPIWQTTTIFDPLGYEQEPFLFYLNEGLNTIRIVSVSEALYINQLKIYQHEMPQPYSQVSELYQNLGYKETNDILVKIQGEDAIYRSGPTIIPEHDMGDPTVEPYDPAEIRMNSLGGHRWKNVGDWATWEFEVPESGLYQIAIKAKQDQRRGVFTNRKLLIDGQVPFNEANKIRFSYDSQYKMHGLETEAGENALVYLDAGVHTLTLEVVLGDVADLLRATEDALYDLNTIYRRIIMITSGQPDPLRSYQLDIRIPGLTDALLEQALVLEGIAMEFESYTGQKGSHTATLLTFVRLLRDMADRPYAIPGLIGEYRDNVGALGTWMQQTMEQPLQIDFIIVASPEQELPKASPTVIQTLIHEVKAFSASFTHDYNHIGEIAGENTEFSDSITVWIGSGRDQAQVIKQMIEDSFTPVTGVGVNLQLIQSMDSLLIPSIIAGTAPDAALGASNMDLAFRGALYDLSQFPDFEEISQRFFKSAFVPFTFREDVFALPEVQGFPMMFYRKDILKELGTDVPQTWDDVYAIIPELKKENMEFGIKPNMNTYQMFLYQKSVALFKEDGVATNLDSETAIQTFNELTDLYRLYSLLYEYNDQNRFRMGEMPILIANYGLYNTLAVFAPELRGEWGMTMVPGTLMEDGTINRTVPVAGTAVAPGATAVPAGTSGAIILNRSDKKDASWEFLKWWTSAEVQTRFGREMETLMGAAARYATANVEAFTQLPWTADEREVLLNQWAWVEGVPPILGGYYVNRQFDWLFRAVVINNEPLRESILDYDRAINDEIARKRDEFGLEIRVEDLSQDTKELYWSHYTHVNKLK